MKKLIIQSEGADEGVYLNDRIGKLIDELLIEWGNADSYKFYNIKVRNKILFHGNTGNGKTTIVRYIAKKVNLPLVEVKADEVIDSHLGSTSANIYKILNDIQQPCVLFWDEVDSIGAKRGGDVRNAAGHENDRMTNSILTNLDKMSDNVIFIAATNRFTSLDSAFLRRFDIKFEVPDPSTEEKQLFLAHLLDYYNLPLDKPDLTDLVSYASIKSSVVGYARKYISNQIKEKILTVS